MLEFLGQVVGYVVPFLLVLTLVLTIHELGHYSAARLFGVRIDRFSLGFGKALLSRMDRRGTEWRLAWLPLGGYVKFSGDLDATGVPDQAGLDALRREIIAEEGAGAERQYFHFKPVWQRAIIVAAGPVANFILAIAIFAALALAVGEVIIVKPRIGSVEPGGPAAVAGLQPGDLIVAVNRIRVRDIEDLQEIAQRNDILFLLVRRDDRQLMLQVR